MITAKTAAALTTARDLIVKHAVVQGHHGAESPLTRSALAERDAALQSVRDIAALADPVTAAWLERWMDGTRQAFVPPTLKTTIADGLEDRRLAALIPNPLR